MTEYQRQEFAGFWLRFVALIIDVMVVSLIVFPFAVIIGLAAPKYLLVEVPFGFFTTTTVVSDAQRGQAAIEKDEVLGLWTNYYKLKEAVTKDGEVAFTRVLIEPEMKREITKTTSSNIELFVIFLYWILMEASIWQASIGKKIIGLKVVNEGGEKPSLANASARNLLKCLSAITLCIGFFMAAWTNKKQTLHDKVARMLVIKEQG